MSKRLRVFQPFTFSVLFALACGKSDGNAQVVPVPTTTSTVVMPPPPPPSDCIAPACVEGPLPPSAHAIRLSHVQWENSTRDLLKLSALSALSSAFPADPAGGADEGSLLVDGPLWKEYQRAAEVFGAQIANDAAALDRILPAAAKTGDVAARTRAFLQDFFPKAFRRPVGEAELTRALAHADRAAANEPAADPFLGRIKWLIASTLQSPSFLYRVEGGEGPVTNGRARLGPYELAAKLSYALQGTMPDEALTGIAKSGKLGTNAGVAEVVTAMLRDPRAEAQLLVFHERFFDTKDFRGVTRQNVNYPNWYSNFGRDAEEDVLRTIKEVIVDKNGSMKDLYVSDVAYMNAKLAVVYGVNPSSIPALNVNPDAFARVQLNPVERIGPLMHVGWLATKGRTKDPATILRGAYMAKHMLCLDLGSPPPAAAGADPDTSTAKTNRDRVDALTRGCGTGCHSGQGGVINPFGFAFENFDALGQIRTKDGTEPVNTASTTELTGAFASGVELMKNLSTNANAHACYAAHWSAFLNGRAKANASQKWLSPIVEKSMKGAPVRDLVVALVQTDAFLTVSR
jgi:Protein of unknown function (DUF1592)/Protein of unknown function (DUF1588)/Protein of unknown function (DUF1595)/Protein of unknown function (DUF1587)